MQYIPWLIAVCAVVVAAYLAVKLNKTRKELKSLCEGLEKSLPFGEEIAFDGGDKHIKRIIAALNRQLNEIERIKRSIEDADSGMKEAIVNISHDLRTPLTAINGYIALLEREEKSESVSRYISQIENRVAAMTVLTEELFGYSLVASVRASSPKPVNVCSALEESLVSFIGAFGQRGITPEIRLPSSAVWRVCDEQALARVFGNVIGNAVKYSESDFSVTMTEDCEITFSNTASSLKNADISRLFERFYTADAEKSSTGLGLAIAKTLTLQMGGDIYAEYVNEKLIIRLRFYEN